MATVELVNLTKQYDGDGPLAVDDVSLSIDDGEFIVLVGPSGCGKSTALRMVAGLESITGGDLMIDGQVMNNVAPKDRDIAMVFQNYALYPHMTVAKNLAYPLRIARVPSGERNQRVEQIAETLQLTEYLDRKPANLSGGQRQRVAMGRALIRQPSVFLMDEPLSNLDAKLRVYMRSEIARIQHELGVTTIYVTHDQVEAMTMGDRVVVLKGGILQQIDSPQNLYDSPANLFVAGFIGSPAMNLVETTLVLDGSEAQLRFGSQSAAVDRSLIDSRPGLAAYDGKTIIAGIRPDDVYDASLRPEFGSRLNANVMVRESLGSEIVCHLDLGLRQVETGDPDLDGLTTEDDTPATFIGRFSPKSQVQVDQKIEISLDLERLHFFDAESGAVIGR